MGRRGQKRRTERYERLEFLAALDRFTAHKRWTILRNSEQARLQEERARRGLTSDDAHYRTLSRLQLHAREPAHAPIIPVAHDVNLVDEHRRVATTGHETPVDA
jgi:hypothetical protein